MVRAVTTLSYHGDNMTPMSIHIIEENIAVRMMLAGLLEMLGFEAQVFNGAVQYLSHVDHPSYVEPAAIFADLRLSRSVYPVETDLLHHRLRKVPWVMMSPMSGMEVALRHCITLPKPFTPQRVKEALDRLGAQSCRSGDVQAGSLFSGVRCRVGGVSAHG